MSPVRSFLCSVGAFAVAASGQERDQSLNRFAEVEYWDTLYSAGPRLENGPLGRPWQDVPLSEFEHTLQPLTRDGQKLRALVLGCGDSVLPEELVDSNVVSEVTAIDFSAVAVAAMVARNREARPNIRWLVGDVTELKMASASFDVVFDVGVFDTIAVGKEESLNRSIIQAHRVLRRGGLLISVTSEAAQSRSILLQSLPFANAWLTATYSIKRHRSLDARVLELNPEFNVGNLSIFVNQAIDETAAQNMTEDDLFERKLKFEEALGSGLKELQLQRQQRKQQQHSLALARETREREEREAREKEEEQRRIEQEREQERQREEALQLQQKRKKANEEQEAKQAAEAEAKAKAAKAAEEAAAAAATTTTTTTSVPATAAIDPALDAATAVAAAEQERQQVAAAAAANEAAAKIATAQEEAATATAAAAAAAEQHQKKEEEQHHQATAEATHREGNAAQPARTLSPEEERMAEMERQSLAAMEAVKRAEEEDAAVAAAKKKQEQEQKAAKEAQAKAEAEAEALKQQQKQEQERLLQQQKQQQEEKEEAERRKQQQQKEQEEEAKQAKKKQEEEEARKKEEQAKQKASPAPPLDPAAAMKAEVERKAREAVRLAREKKMKEMKGEL